jgi:hypothetical protein
MQRSAACLMQAERLRGCRNSALLWLFWLVFLMCQVLCNAVQ